LVLCRQQGRHLATELLEAGQLSRPWATGTGTGAGTASPATPALPSSPTGGAGTGAGATQPLLSLSLAGAAATEAAAEAATPRQQPEHAFERARALLSPNARPGSGSGSGGGSGSSVERVDIRPLGVVPGEECYLCRLVVRACTGQLALPGCATGCLAASAASLRFATSVLSYNAGHCCTPPTPYASHFHRPLASSPLQAAWRWRCSAAAC